MDEMELATAEDCRPLYELMARIKQLAPWEYLEEGDIFGVIDPDTGEPNFVSIMGMAGEHYAIALYQGVRGLYSFLRVEEAGPDTNLAAVLDLPPIPASSEDREMVEKRDREHMKALGLKFRGRNAWPIFRSHQPGYAPWHIEKAEARTLVYALEQLLDVVPRLVNTDEDLLMPGDDDEFLVRVSEQTTGGPVWRDETMRFVPPPPYEMTIRVDTEALDKVRQLPIGPRVVEIDCFRTLSIVAPPGGRPFFPYTLLMVGGKTGMPLGVEMLSPIPTPEAMWSEVGATVLRMLIAVGDRPREFHVRHNLLFGILSMLSEQMGIKVKHTRALDKLDLVANSLMAFLDR